MIRMVLENPEYFGYYGYSDNQIEELLSSLNFLEVTIQHRGKRALHVFLDFISDIIPEELPKKYVNTDVNKVYIDFYVQFCEDIDSSIHEGVEGVENIFTCFLKEDGKCVTELMNSGAIVKCVSNYPTKVNKIAFAKH